ncbi:MAG: alpha/beta fold hydrolase [Planctomycetota bacterium]
MAADVLNELTSKKADAVVERFSDKMKELLPANKLKLTMVQLEFVAGSFKENGPIKTIAKDPLTIEATAYHQRKALVYRLTFQGKLLIGLYVRPESLPTGDSASDPASASNETDVSIARDGFSLSGTLCLPSEGRLAQPVPLVIFHSGSGPTDRNGNGPLIETNATLKLARALANQGIASVRYDKRGSGKTGLGGSESDLRAKTYVDDYKAWISRYASDKRFSKLVLLGHSEGAHFAFQAAHNNPPVAGVISVAGSGRPFNELLRSQLKNKLPEPLYSEADSILNQLALGKVVEEVSVELVSVLRPSVQPFFISLLESTPENDARTLSVPLMVVQGDQDMQVSIEDANRLEQAGKKVEKVIVEGMNHVLVDIDAPEKQLASYSNPDLPLSKKLAPSIAKFVWEIAGGDHEN